MHQFAAYSEEYEVSGIIKDFPKNSHFKIDLLTSIDKPEDYHETAWVYFKTKEKADIKKLTAEIDASIKASDKEEYVEWISPVLTPIKDIHLKSHLARELEKNVRCGNVLIIFIAGMLAVLLAG